MRMYGSAHVNLACTFLRSDGSRKKRRGTQKTYRRDAHARWVGDRRLEDQEAQRAGHIGPSSLTFIVGSYCVLLSPPLRLYTPAIIYGFC
jgi:hypothetical protein